MRAVGLIPYRLWEAPTRATFRRREMKFHTIVITLLVDSPEGYDITENIQFFLYEMCSKMEEARLDVSISGVEVSGNN